MNEILSGFAKVCAVRVPYFASCSLRCRSIQHIS